MPSADSKLPALGTLVSDRKLDRSTPFLHKLVGLAIVGLTLVHIHPTMEH